MKYTIEMWAFAQHVEIHAQASCITRRVQGNTIIKCMAGKKQLDIAFARGRDCGVTFFCSGLSLDGPEISSERFRYLSCRCS